MALHKKDSLSKVPLIALLSKCFYLEDHQIFTTYVCMKLLLYFLRNEERRRGDYNIHLRPLIN